jgi:hypothetical protein
MRGGRVAQDQFGHQLGGPVRRFRQGPRILAHRLDAGRAIDGGGRGEDEMRYLLAHRRGDQIARLAGVVLVVKQWIGH